MPLKLRSVSEYDNVLLQFTSARLITNYNNVPLQITIAWLLQFSTTVVTIYDDCYYNLRQIYYNSRQNKLYGSVRKAE